MHLKESEAAGKISGLEKKIQYAEIEKVIFLTNVLANFSSYVAQIIGSYPFGGLKWLWKNT